MNALLCALWSAARCEILPRFDHSQVWRKFVERDLTLFVGVPTMYARLLKHWEASSAGEQKMMSRSCGKLRLMVSGSSAHPPSLFERWTKVTGHRILERYGMIEIGMTLSSPLHGERVPGYVGTPLPCVEVRLLDEDGAEAREGEPGEIFVRGPTVFLEYWRRPVETGGALRDGWFQTGDIAVVENGLYRVLGRKSTDIIKTGGYKVSALEIEEALRAHPAIEDCAVVGAPDKVWGERVSVAVVLRHGHPLTLEELREWGKRRLAPYKVPSRMLIVEELPRNPLGKVLKPVVKLLFEGGGWAES